jgi:hypothetical protein
MDCRTALLTLLDSMDYTVGNCRPNEMVGAVVPAEMIRMCRQAAQHALVTDVSRRCPACNALLEETSVYCDNCGTDTPRR